MNDIRDKNVSTHLGLLLFCLLLIAYAGYAYWSGGIVGRSGSVAVARLESPLTYWISLGFIVSCGLLGGGYALGRLMGWFRDYVRMIDSLFDRADR